jgi:hypothetical protein
MIMAFFIGFSYATFFLDTLSPRQLEGFATTPIAEVQHQKKRLRDLLLNVSRIFFKCLAMGRYSLADTRYDSPQRVRIRLTKAAAVNEMSRSIPHLAGFSRFFEPEMLIDSPIG